MNQILTICELQEQAKETQQQAFLHFLESTVPKCHMKTEN